MGYIFFFYGCPIAWSSKLGNYVTLSTNHSEYCAAARGARQAKFLQNLLLEMGMEQHRGHIQRQQRRNRNVIQPSATAGLQTRGLTDHYVREQVDAGALMHCDLRINQRHARRHLH